MAVKYDTTKAGIAQIHPPRVTQTAPAPSASPRRINGTANIIKKVYLLPQIFTAKRCIPKAVAINIALATVISRIKTARPNHIGTELSIKIAISATMNNPRSTAGSKTAPKLLCWLNRRATQPSIQSVAPRPPSNHAAAPLSRTLNNNHKNIGKQHSRINVIAFGNVRICRFVTQQAYKTQQSY